MCESTRRFESCLLRMSTLEIMKQLKEREEKGLTADQVVDLCFQAMVVVEDPVEQSRAAVILSGIVQKGLGDRTKEFLSQHPDLPERVHQILGSSIMRMEGF